MSQGPASDRPDRPTIPAQMQQEWNRALDQIFSSAMSRPDIYERVTTLVGQVVRHLRDQDGGAADLLDAWADPHRLISQVQATDPAASADGLDLTRVVGAACVMRYREVVAEQQESERRQALAGAADPKAWIVLSESGVSAGDPFAGYQRFEAQPASGFTVAVGTRPDDTFAGCIHSVDVLRLDPQTGRFTEVPPQVTAKFSWEGGAEADREEAAARIKRGLLERPTDEY